MGNAVKTHDERKNKQAAPGLNTRDVEKLREELRKELEKMTDAELIEEAIRVLTLLKEKMN